MRVRTSLITLAAIGLGLLTTAAAAWACTGLASIATDPRSGLAGQTVKVYGDVFREGPIEIRWNSSEGPVLAETTGPGFTAKITIPEAGPGEHIVMALQRAEDGTIARKALAVFTVTTATAAEEAQPTPPEPAEPAPAAQAPPAPTPARAVAPARPTPERAIAVESPAEVPAPAAPAPAATNEADPAPSVPTPGVLNGDPWSGFRYDLASHPAVDAPAQPERPGRGLSPAVPLLLAVAAGASGTMLALRRRVPHPG